MNLTKPIPKNFDEMVATMLLCEQSQGQSVYQHGQSVCSHLFDLIDHIKGVYKPPEGYWKLPEWPMNYAEELLCNLHDEDKIRQYTTYHDCGKILCKQVDAEGRVHFPDHARLSKELWLSVGGDKIVGELIGDDMFIHTSSANEINQRLISGWDIKDASTLLFSAIAEIHSNAVMFGGIESLSFKSKFKIIDRRGKQICKFFHD